MLEVGRFSVLNNAGIVACINVVYQGDSGTDHEVSTKATFLPLQTRDASPGECNVPDGSTVWLKIDVTAGYPNKSKECFIYRAESRQVADFTITGTNLNNKLEFLGLRSL